MSTTKERPVPLQTPRPAIGSASLILGGIAFIIGGALHPQDSGHGNKVQQLHDMLVSGAWYPAHVVLVLSMGLFALALLTLRQRRGLRPSMTRVVRVVTVITVVATIGMTVHLLEAVKAGAVADGRVDFYVWLQTANEILVDATWGGGLAVLAVVGGVTGALGNRFTMLLGLVGGACFALASATIPFTDRFDPLFPVSSLLGVWAVAVGALELRRKA
jgi:hypothetical protein